ncbi:hypothetical protein [Dethiobacter alkaliphilus]|uniref:hypothetical protein n=1 Tax=Dethiobacter alkaliphilus TaxID=427926 RepID=UPI0022279E4C|nr:hypothetical protein [Dethiobacter alkaliphilus]MCW3491000.1 hypothetical protein [Dethiobacter alkaliphilus]
MLILPTLLIYFLVLAGVIVLQIFVSKTESKWPGLILPAITLLFSLIGVLSIMPTPGHSIISIVFQILAAFLLYNIPTAILVGIYFASRGKRKNREIEKMSIEDLE